MLSSRFLLALPFLFALCCTVSKEQLSTYTPPEEIRFNVLDGINNSFEGSDNIVILSTAAEIQQATLYVKSYPYILNYESHALTSMGNGRFETSLNFGPQQVRWYIGASSGLGASTSYGTFNDPAVSEKYITKTSADLIIKDILNTGLSSGNVYQTYAPNSTGNTHTYNFRDAGGNAQSINVDHYTTLFTSASAWHNAYGIEYSTLVTTTGNNQLPVTGANLNTERYLLLQQGPVQNFGYVMIGTTDKGSLERILVKPDFFPKIALEDQNLLNFLQVIRY